jgi:hypothetical protein
MLPHSTWYTLPPLRFPFRVTVQVDLPRVVGWQPNERWLILLSFSTLSELLLPPLLLVLLLILLLYPSQR